MYKRLKEEYIIQQSPFIPMLVNQNEQCHFELSESECALFEYLDGLHTYENIIEEIFSFLNIGDDSFDEKEVIISNIKMFFYKYDEMIESSEVPFKRSKIFYGNDKYIIPFELSIELTDKCILACKHCYKNANPHNETFINYQSLINFLSSVKNDVDCIQLTGGEPMLHPHFFDILHFCKENFNNVIISTTGLLITESAVKEFIGTHIYLSLYSFNEKENDDYTVYNAQQKVLNAAGLLVNNHVYTCINTIVSDGNINFLPSFIKQCETLGVQGLGIGKVVKVGRGKYLSPLDFCSPQTEEQVKEIEKNFFSNSMYLSTFANNDTTEAQVPHCGLYRWIINENGNILPCAFFPQKFKIGHITDDIQSVFNKRKFLLMKKELRKWGTELGVKGISLTDVCPALEFLDN